MWGQSCGANRRRGGVRHDSRVRAPGSVVVGALFAAGGAVSYGVTVVVGRSLAEDGVDSATALGVRFGVAAVLLLALSAAMGLPLVPARGERLRVLLLGGIGFTTEATLFYLALERGTAAAVILLFYAYPAMIALTELVRGHERPGPVTLGALGLSGAGTAVVVASGSDVSIGAAGVALALCSGAVYAAFLLVGRELVRRTGPVTVSAWVALGASASSLLRGVVSGGPDVPSGHAGALLLYGAATVGAFALTFAALHRIGAARTAVISTLEAFSAVVGGALFLQERITVVQALGGLAVVGAAALVAVTPARTASRRPA